MGTRNTSEMGVTPGGRLDLALRVLKRPERRILLAILSGADTPRRERLQRRLDRRVAERGLVI